MILTLTLPLDRVSAQRVGDISHMIETSSLVGLMTVDNMVITAHGLGEQLEPNIGPCLVTDAVGNTLNMTQVIPTTNHCCCLGVRQGWVWVRDCVASHIPRRTYAYPHYYQPSVQASLLHTDPHNRHPCQKRP